ncbi:MAG: cyclopropane-fatty-acyl-phospholipid synthase [Pseudonocardiales bacterium]|jgi:cyclopropane-fatty-acyl-phospholipid synthase|nr:cyclopropane-fatty-acyl-phospholipid synthase [Pseudonocardiales bacterium]
MTVARKLAQLISPLLGGELPVRIRAWDGSETGPADGPTLQLTSRRALRRLLTPKPWPWSARRSRGCGGSTW